MAQQGFQMDQEKLSCSICLDLLKDPVTIPCGHSYCMNCIRSYWDGQYLGQTHSCPQCRQTFRKRPDLKKSTVLADLVEELKKTRLQFAPADLCYAGPGDVSCDFCTGRKLKAVKSCLQCLVSYCEQHLQPHYQSPAFKKHKLVDLSMKLEENICPRHNEVMKIFCRTDQQCICSLCSLNEHKRHDTVSASAERSQKQKELKSVCKKIRQRIQDREKDVRMLQQEVEAVNQSADKAVSNSEKIFKDLIRLIEKRSSEVKQQIRSKQTDEVRKVTELQEKLEQELVELRRKSSELEQLSHTEDHIQFLHNYPFMSHVSESTKPANMASVERLRCFDEVTAAVSKVRDKLQDVLKEDWTKTSPRPQDVSGLKTLSQAEPKTRAEFLQYSRRFTLDPNTAHSWLLLSEGNRRATVNRGEIQSYPDHPDRFIDQQQVLSRESLTGRCYWEVELDSAVGSVAVTYKDISRTGSQSEFGYNNRSWALEDFDTFIHNSIKTTITDSASSRIGVYLDHSAGVLSFYSVSDIMTLIHRVQTTFTEPLYAGFRVYGFDCSVVLYDLQ